MADLKNFIAEFKELRSEEDVDKFVQRFELSQAGEHPKAQVIGFFKGTVGDSSVTITHRWYDRCRPFSIQPDGNKVLLEIEGMESIEIGFLDDF